MSRPGKPPSPEVRLETFLERLRRIAGEERFDRLRDALSREGRPALRANPFRASAADLCAELESAGFLLEPVEWYGDAFVLAGGERRDLLKSPAWSEGRFHLQNLSSMVPPLVLDPQPGESVLDMAAAPGSKTTQIAALMRGEGRIVACDRSRSRIWKLRSVVKRLGCPGIEIVCRPGESFGATHRGSFDRVLVDAPCSGEGRFRLDREESWSDWTLGKVRRCARVQKMLLKAALRAAKPGGIVVYSTCTLSPEENEAVLNSALVRTRDGAEIEPIRWPGEDVLPGRTEWLGRTFHPSVAGSLRLLPTADREGFFIARLRKL